MLKGKSPVPQTNSYDALVVGAGRDTIGGGALTLPGFLHDVCSAVHPLAIGSPFFSTLPLSEHGLDWVQSPAPP